VHSGLKAAGDRLADLVSGAEQALAIDEPSLVKRTLLRVGPIILEPVLS
jgi:hypothetical protein